MRRKDEDPDETWESDAQVTYYSEAMSEFNRLKHDLKKKAGLVPLTPWERVQKLIQGILKRIRGYFGRGA